MFVLHRTNVDYYVNIKVNHLVRNVLLDVW